MKSSDFLTDGIHGCFASDESNKFSQQEISDVGRQGLYPPGELRGADGFQLKSVTEPFIRQAFADFIQAPVLFKLSL